MADNTQDSVEDGSLFNESPLLVLSLNTLDKLGQYLNGERLIESMDGHLRDWRGLASVAGLNWQEQNQIREIRGQQQNPTRHVISIWCKNHGSSKTNTVSVREFLDLLSEKLDRRDVADSKVIKGNKIIAVNQLICWLMS